MTRSRLKSGLAVAVLSAAVGCALLPDPAAAQAPAPALDLLSAWRAASSQDATLRAARAAAEAGRERVPQAVAAMRPGVSFSASRLANERHSVVTGVSGESLLREDYYSGLQTLSVRQGIYRPQHWALLALAEAQQAQSEAVLRNEQQQLGTRVAEAYFELLLALDQLDLAVTLQRGAAVQLQAARLALAAGSGLRTDIDEAQARVDLIAAQRLEAEQGVHGARQQLATLVTQDFGSVAPLDPTRPGLPALEPLAAWQARAETASPELAALAARRDAVAQTVERARAEHLPTLDAVAQWQRSDRQIANRADDRYRTAQIGLQFNLPLYAGGGHASAERQARAELEQAREALEAARRELTLRVSREWRGVSEGTARIAALRQAAASGEQAVRANQRSQAAGARSTLDVLKAQETLANTQRDLARARYLQLVSLVRLHALAGSADEALMTQVNSLLRH